MGNLAWCEIVMKKTKEYIVDELQVRNSHGSVAWGGGGGGSLAIWLATHPCPKKASIGYIFQPYGGVDVFLKKGGVFFILHRTLGVPCSTMLQNNSNTPFRVIFAGFTPFGGVNETWCDTPFRVQFRGWWTRVGSQLVCEWPPPPPGGGGGGAQWIYKTTDFQLGGPRFKSAGSGSSALRQCTLSSLPSPSERTLNCWSPGCLLISNLLSLWPSKTNNPTLY